MSRIGQSTPSPHFQESLNRLNPAAQRLGISLRKLQRLIASGQIMAVKVGARGTRIAESELARYMNKLIADAAV
jgi:excisionase family DNA binding protein